MSCFIERVAPIVGQAPIGSGDRPRSVLFADARTEVVSLIERFPELLEPAVRSLLNSAGVWLVRPDGYVGGAAKKGDERIIADYLQALVGKRQD